MASCEIVVGIDFGTTHTGVSWRYNPATTNDIEVINNWIDPRRSNSTSDKVPSQIIYDEAGRPRLWGFEASRDEFEIPIRWFKVLMDEEHMQDGLDKDPIFQTTKKKLKDINKTAEDVLVDYIQCVWDWTMKTIKENDQDEIVDMCRCRIVITVPAIWDSRATDKTRRAVAKVVDWPVEVVQEPEAAAFYTLNYMMRKEAHDVKRHDCYLVCDAGGGTVDLMAFEVQNIEPLAMEPIVKASGRVCGSILLDRSFLKYMKRRVGPENFDKLSEARIETMMVSFEDRVKKAFKYDAPRDKRYPVQLKGVPPGEDIDVEEQRVYVSGDELQAIFIPVCNQIWKLISDHKLEVEEMDKKIKAILLVGGFGMSDFLKGFIEEKCTPGGMRVHRLLNNIMAVCKGATMLGVERSKASQIPGHIYPVTSAISRCSYGVIDTDPDEWDAQTHRPFDYIKHPVTGKRMVKNQMKWLLKYGDRIDPDRIEKMIISKYVQVAHKKLDVFEIFPEDVKFQTELFYCKSPRPPRQLSNQCIPLRTLNVTLKGRRVQKKSRVFVSQTRERLYKVKYNLQLKLGNHQLTFELNHADKEHFEVDPVDLDDDIAQGPSQRQLQAHKRGSEPVLSHRYVYQSQG